MYDYFLIVSIELIIDVSTFPWMFGSILFFLFSIKSSVRNILYANCIKNLIQPVIIYFVV